jgi:CrcB protein
VGRVTTETETGGLSTPPAADPALAEPALRRPHRAGAPPAVLGAIALGGFVGGLTRYGLGRAFPTARTAFPTTTFAINVSGSFALALLLVFVLEIWRPTRYLRPLLGVGFAGAYTTFSTWMVDADRLAAAGRGLTATWYVLGSIAAGLAATSLGLAVGRAVVAHRRRPGAPRPAP